MLNYYDYLNSPCIDEDSSDFIFVVVVHRFWSILTGSWKTNSYYSMLFLDGKFVLAHYARTDAPVISQPVSESEASNSVKQKSWLNRYEIFPQEISDELEEQYEAMTDDQVSQAHGILIALGLIEFDLVSRSDGLGYMLTTAGKRLLANSGSAETHSHEDGDFTENQSFNDQSEAA